MWHLFWQKAWSKQAQVILLGGILLCPRTHAQQPAHTAEFPGPVESLELLIKNQKEQYAALLKEVPLDPTLTNAVINAKEIKIHPLFMHSILLHSDPHFVQVMSGEECLFYGFLESNLLRSQNGPIEFLVVNFKNKNNEMQTTRVSRETYLKNIFQNKCQNNNEFAFLFNIKNVDRTISNLKLAIPSGLEECRKVLASWRKNPFLPYLCQYPQEQEQMKQLKQKVQDGSLTKGEETKLLGLSNQLGIYQAKVNDFNRNFIANLCTNLDSPVKFCRPYLGDQIWQEVLSGVQPNFLLTHRCAMMQSKNGTDLKQCANQLNTNPEICSVAGIYQYPALFPRENCHATSQSLRQGRLKTDYHDCPGRIDHEGITNIYRILRHFLPPDHFNAKSLECNIEIVTTYAKFSLEFHQTSKWPLEICWDDPIQNKNLCRPYLAGDIPNESMAEGKIVADVINHLKGSALKKPCKILPDYKYQPTLLEFARGCFITYNPAECHTFHCPKKIYYNLQPVEKITYRGKLKINYIPNNYLDHRNSLIEMIDLLYKIKSNNIYSLTDIRFFLDLNSNNLIHGVGCVEDLLPQFFQKKYFNQCRPIPFIIDGFFQQQEDSYLVIRTSIDDVHFPRAIIWHRLYNAVSNYQKYHPLNTWTLYGLSQEELQTGLQAGHQGGP